VRPARGNRRPRESGRPAQASELIHRPVSAPGGVHALVRCAGAFAFVGPSAAPKPDIAG